jgi:hypothetical protein
MQGRGLRVGTLAALVVRKPGLGQVMWGRCHLGRDCASGGKTMRTLVWWQGWPFSRSCVPLGLEWYDSLVLNLLSK